MKNRVRFLVNTAYWGVIGLFVVLSFRYLVPAILPFIFGFIVAALWNPLVTRVSKQRKRWLASALLIFPFWGILLFLLWKIGAMLYGEVVELLRWIQNTDFEQFFSSLNLPLPEGNFGQWISDRADKIFPAVLELSQGVLRRILDLLLALPNAFIFSFAMVVSSFLFSLTYPKIEPFILRQLSLRLQAEYFDVKDFLVRKIFRILRAYGIMVSINFTELLIGFWILKIPYPLILAAMIAVCDLFPYIGIVSILVPWGVVEWVVLRNSALGMGLIIMAIILSVVRQILEPKVIGKTIGLSALTTLFCVYAGLRLIGISGIVLFPLAALFIKEWNESGRLSIWKREPD